MFFNVIDEKEYSKVIKADYIEGSVKVQVAFGLLLVIFAVIFIFVLSTVRDALVTIETLNSENPYLAAKMAGRLLLWMVLSSGVIAAVIGVYLLSLARKIRVEGAYPPLGYPVAIRTKVRRGVECHVIKNMFSGLGWLLLAHPVAGLLVWYWVTGGYL